MPQRLRVYMILGLVAIVLLAIGRVAFSYYYRYRMASFTPPAVVAVSTVTAQPWQNTLQAVGTLEASQGVILKSEVAGLVTAVYFRSGDEVKEGQPLVQLNPAIPAAQFATAKAQTQLSAADYQRALQLYRKKVFAKADLDKALANYQANQAQEAKASAALAQTTIRAPFSGRLGLRNVNKGDYLDPSRGIVNLNAITPLRINFQVPGTTSSQIKLGSQVFIQSNAYPKQTFVAKVYAVDSQIDAATRSLAVRAVLDNASGKLLPGAFVEVSLQLGTPESLPTIPETALNTDEKGSYVYRALGNIAVKTPVTILFEKSGQVGVSGLKIGEKIISIGSFKVHDKAPIIIGK